MFNTLNLFFDKIMYYQRRTCATTQKCAGTTMCNGTLYGVDILDEIVKQTTLHAC